MKSDLIQSWGRGRGHELFLNIVFHLLIWRDIFVFVQDSLNVLVISHWCISDASNTSLWVSAVDLALWRPCLLHLLISVHIPISDPNFSCSRRSSSIWCTQNSLQATAVRRLHQRRRRKPLMTEAKVILCFQVPEQTLAVLHVCARR